MLERQIVAGADARVSRARWRTRSAGRRCSSGTPWPRSAAASGRARWSSWARISTAGTWGTGITDNGTGSMVVLEAARALAHSGLKPKRTIRFILFSGEEEGLLGSRAYAAAHAAEADSIQAVLVLDNGTGAITGQALQGRTELEGSGSDLLAPVASLGADSVRDAEQVRHRPPVLPSLRRARASTSTSSPGATPTPTTRRATPTTRPCRATSSRPRRSWR